jgi:hypothetical protein
MPAFMRPASLVIAAFVAIACSGAATTQTTRPPSEPGSTPSASAGPAASPATSPTAEPVGAIDHATGPADVILRFEQDGGFMEPTFLATQTPIFTLFGDGTIVFRNPAADPPPAIGGLQPFSPLRTARLDEEQIQSLLELALGQGGLGIARPTYLDLQVADAPSSVFTIDAGGVTKTVTVVALGIDTGNGPDAPARAAFQGLAERLADFDAGGAFPTQVYAPDRYRGIVTEGVPGDPAAIAWPWADLAPSAFVMPGDPNAFQLATGVLTVAQVEALGIEPYQGGFLGLTLVGPGDGKLYSLSLRPLLPDETS